MLFSLTAYFYILKEVKVYFQKEELIFEIIEKILNEFFTLQINNNLY